jgi:hypothetical protein
MLGIRTVESSALLDAHDDHCTVSGRGAEGDDHANTEDWRLLGCYAVWLL